LEKLYGKTTKGPPLRFENFHHRLDVDLSLLDRVKVLFGAKIDLSLCGRIDIYLHEDQKYNYMKFGDIQPKVVVWYNEPPQMLSANMRFAISERSKQLRELQNDGNKT